MNKKFIFLLIGIFMISSVCALGVTPARTTIDFKPNLERVIEFEIINSGGQDISLTLSAQGDLGKYISVSSSAISLLSSEGSRILSYEINLPDELSPGLHTGEVLIAEVPQDTQLDGSYVQATLAVAIQLHIYVPYPGKYASSKMIIYNAVPGEDVVFVFPVVSQGEFDLTSVRANVDVYNKLNEKVGSFNTQSISVPSGEKKEIVYGWGADVPIGNYRAVASLIYDEGTISLEEMFSIGSQDLELQEIGVSSFSLGEIAKLEMLVENKWSEPISGVYTETKIMNDEGDVVSSFESASYDIDALSKKVFVSYWDTAGVRVGEYETEISINYGDKSSKSNLKFQVEENKLTVIGLGYVVSAEAAGESNALVTVLIIVIVVLVLINLLWFLLLRKKFKK
ncbi:MAG: hypothetical protein ABIF18_02415 [archaeon]